MARKQSKVKAGLLGVAGAVSAYFGARALVNWFRRRQEQQQFGYYDRQRAAGRDIPYSSMPSGTPVPGMSQMGMPEAGMPEAGMPETTMPEARMPQTGMPESGFPEAGVPREGYGLPGRTPVDEAEPFLFESEREHDRDRAAIPTTGMMDAPVMDTPRTQERTRDYGAVGSGTLESTQAETNQPLPVAGLVGPLVVHLLSFHNMMDMLRRRRDTIETTSATESDVPDVRNSGPDAIDSLLGQLPEFDHSALVRGSLQERIFSLMERIRDALQNTQYSDEQLFRIHDELRPEACKVLNQIHQAEEDNVTGFEDVQKAYNCR